MCQNWRCARLPGFLPSLESAHRRWRRSACSSRGSRSGSASSPAAFAPVRLAFLQLPPRASGLYYRQCAPLTELRSEIRQNQQSQIGPVLPLHAPWAVSYDGRTIRSLSLSFYSYRPHSQPRLCSVGMRPIPCRPAAPECKRANDASERVVASGKLQPRLAPLGAAARPRVRPRGRRRAAVCCRYTTKHT